MAVSLELAAVRPLPGGDFCVRHQRYSDWFLSRFINRLRLAAGGVVGFEELADALYGGDPEGGPLTLRTSLRVMAGDLRKLGYPVTSAWGRGYYYKSSFTDFSTLHVAPTPQIISLEVRSLAA